MAEAGTLVAALALGYILGSIPFGLLFTRFAGLGDVRAIGSGSIGATNVLRTGRKDLTAATVICDALKGTAAALIAMHFGLNAALAAAAGAFLGHLFPVWLGFRGGKGIATYVGLVLAFSWIAVLVFAVLWIAVAVTTRYSSLSSIVAVIGAPIALWLLDVPAMVPIVFTVLSLIALVMHRANISRLLAGTETKIGAKAAPSGE